MVVVSPAVEAPEFVLSPDDARRMTLRAQGFLGIDGRRGGVPGMLRRIGAVQLDTISVLARSHELVAYARLGPVPRERIERAYWHPRAPTAFEYWSHAACILPVEEWPFYAFRRRAVHAAAALAHGARASLRRGGGGCGPRAADRHPARRGQSGGQWWDWSETKIAVEWMLDVGDVICVRRGLAAGLRPARAGLPRRTARPGSPDSECLAHLARGRPGAGRGHPRRPRGLPAAEPPHRHGDAAARQAGRGIGAEGRAHPGGDRRAGRDERARVGRPRGPGPRPGGPRGRHRAVLLSPFDSLVWDRKRTLRMFGFEHSLEAYVPKPKRVHGYFAMPLLAGGRLVGRADPVRRGTTLVARQLSLDTAAAVEPMAGALREAAEWVGCTSVELGQVSPPHLAGRLHAALA